MSNYLQGKYIWLIGASFGIGSELALQLSKMGANVAISARNEEKLKTLISTMPTSNHLIQSLDVTNMSSLEIAWQNIISSWPQLDMVIYNAGVYEPMSALEFNYPKAEEMLQVNLLGAFRVMSLIVPYFVARNSGHIALVGSVAGYRGLPNSIGYCVSKAGIINFAENLKIDLVSSNIKVQIFNPGFVETRLTAKNNFKMPLMISAQKAASYIIKGFMSNSFEIHFPKKFTCILKLFSLLPNNIYFALMRKIKI